MAKSMSFTQFVDEVAKRTQSTRKDAKQWVEHTFDTISALIPKGVRIPGFGKFQVRQLKARMGRNPATGVAIKIAARSKVAFSAAKELKEKYNKKGK